MVHYEMTYDEAREARCGAWIDPGDFAALPARAALCRTGDGHAKVSRVWKQVDCPACLAKAPPMMVRRAFTHSFGAGANGLTVDVPAGARCDWHRENGCFYVRPSELPAYAQHDAEYRGVDVPLSNLTEA